MKELSRIKNIEFLKATNEILKEVLDEHNSFDIIDYYENKHDAALGIITPKKYLNVYALISHELVCQNIYRLLYKGFEKFPEDEDLDWQQKATNYGNMILQFVRDEYLFVWFPNQWNEFQAKTLRRIMFQIEAFCLKTNRSLIYCNGNQLCDSVESLLWYIKDERIELEETSRLEKSLIYKK